MLRFGGEKYQLFAHACSTNKSKHRNTTENISGSCAPRILILRERTPYCANNIVIYTKSNIFNATVIFVH